MAEFEFADLLPEIASDAPGVNELAVVRCARLATRYFCEETDFLTVEGAPLDLVAAQATYTVQVDPLERVIVRATDVWIGDDWQLVRKSSDQFDREDGQPREHQPWTAGHADITFNTMQRPWRLVTENPPQFFFQEQPTTVRLVGIPEQAVAAALRITTSVKPAATQTTVDRSIIDAWYETLVMGTKALALQMKQKPWSDLKHGLVLQQEFETKVALVVANQARGFSSDAHVVGRVRAYP